MNIDRPSAAFGRRGREIRAPVALSGRPARSTSVIGRIVPLFGVASLLAIVAGAILWAWPGIQKLNAESTQAEQRVIEIVNQPVTHLPLSGPVREFSPGWFHPGAIKPDFNNVDIRATQQLLYDGDNVTSDVDPSEMFDGSGLEFNSMTKYFYTDRTVPKKRLSNAEMIEINGLYRVVGQDERGVSIRWLTMVGSVAIGLLAYALLLLVRQTRRFAAA